MRAWFHTATTLLLAAPLYAGEARAQAEPTVVEDAHPRRVASVTFSPFHLVLPVVELTGEWRAGDRLGLALVLGGGSVKPRNILNNDPSIAVWEAGAQVRYYVLGDFRHGMQLGGEAIYMHASSNSGTVRADGDGLSLGAFAGYKVIADVGFTFDAQLGY